MMNSALSPLVGLAVAAAIGLLVGIERGWRTRKLPPGSRVAGIRTFTLLGVAGALTGLLYTNVAPVFGVVALIGVIAALLAGHVVQLRRNVASVSVTDAIVGVIVTMLGVLAMTGYATEAVAVAGVTTLILSMREELHAWVRSLNEKDVKAAAQYAVIAVVILPMLPDTPTGPYDALNLRHLWLVVVFVTGLSFAGYWASKRLGAARGTIIAAAIGATYSSTAITLELARRLRDPGEERQILNAGIAAATAMMPIRVMVLVGVLLTSALPQFVIGVGPGALLSLLYALWVGWNADRSTGANVVVRNPFDFWPAVGFAALVAVILVVSHWTIDHFGDRGLAVLVGLTGLYDVDAAIIMVSNLPTGTLGGPLLGLLLTLPIAVNSIIKLVMLLSIAGVREGVRAGVPLITSTVLMLAGMAWLGWSSGMLSG